MTIKFEGPDETNGYQEWYAVSQLEVWKGKAHDELLWAEIRMLTENRWRVVWEDSWQDHSFFNSFHEAKDYVARNYSTHRPHINGTSFNIDEL